MSLWSWIFGKEEERISEYVISSDFEYVNDLEDVSQESAYPQPLHCLRCGHELVLERITRNGVEHYHCTNTESCCHSGELKLMFHHPNSWQRGPGDSYSLSYIK
jgi:hypothetical protein